MLLWEMSSFSTKVKKYEIAFASTFSTSAREKLKRIEGEPFSRYSNFARANTFPQMIVARVKSRRDANSRTEMTRMNKKFMIIVLLLKVLSYLEIVECTLNYFNETERHRSQRETDETKRYLVFPQGSNVQLIYCLTIGTYAKPSTFFTIGVTAGLAWELPHENTVPYRKPAEVYHRRSRRELYRKVELMLSTRGKDGKACVRKALCQAGKRKRSEIGKGTFVQEILHSIFTLPSGSYDEDSMTEYEKSYHTSVEDDCEIEYPSCPETF